MDTRIDSQKIINEIFSEQTWKLLKNKNNEICHHNASGCKFNVKSDNKIYVIGDSNLASLTFDLKNKVVQKNYQFITYTYGGCVFLPGFDYISRKTEKVNKYCNDEFFQNIKKNYSKKKIKF